MKGVFGVGAEVTSLHRDKAASCHVPGAIIPAFLAIGTAVAGRPAHRLGAGRLVSSMFRSTDSRNPGLRSTVRMKSGFPAM